MHRDIDAQSSASSCNLLINSQLAAAPRGAAKQGPAPSRRPRPEPPSQSRWR